MTKKEFLESLGFETSKDGSIYHPDREYYYYNHLTIAFNNTGDYKYTYYVNATKKDSDAPHTSDNYGSAKDTNHFVYIEEFLKNCLLSDDPALILFYRIKNISELINEDI